ncbi:myosin-11-like isoform X2 [Cimex lectularius]|uniref:Uncharacterized protein n=1 Tax=Cimex lectularius TaxID=79782 RepID=A0A8I6RNL3_CIMLE|nr:myosin-11-like isoform X2 [Cimex lectularius]
MDGVSSNEGNASNDELEVGFQLLDELDEPWTSEKTSPTPWSDVGPLSEELRRLDEELKQQNDEARAWLEEECAADEILRSEINELQIARQKTQNLLTLELNIPPEVKDKINNLEVQVRTLQDQLQEKSDKLAESYEVYSEVLSKLNETNERVIANDNKFKQSLLKVKEEYSEVESILRKNLDTYKSLNKELQLQLNEKESELAEFKESKGNVNDLENTVKELEGKLEELKASNDNLNKVNLKLKAHLKKIKESEKETLGKEKQSIDLIENLQKSIVQLQEENVKLKECSVNEEIETLKNQIVLLEEEKGNLQLQLVDLDEIKEAADSTFAKFNKLEKDKESLEKKLEDVEDENKNLILNNEELKKKLQDLDETIAKLREALQGLTEEKISAVMKSVEIEEQFCIKERELVQIKEQLVSLQEFQALKGETDFKTECTPSQKEHLEGQLANVTKELSSQTDFVQALQNNVSSLQSEIEYYKTQHCSILAEVDELRRYNSDIDAQLKEALAKKEKAKQDLVGIAHPASSDNKDLTQKYKQLVLSFKKKKQMCLDFEANVEKLNKEIATFNDEKASLVQQLNDSQNQIKQLEDELNVSKMESANLIASMQNADLQIPTLLENVNQSRAIIKEKEEIIADLDVERNKLSDVVKGYEMELEMLRELYEKESKKNEGYYSDLMNLEKEMNESKSELLNRLEQVTTNYDKALETLQEKDNYVVFCEEEVERLRSKVISLETELDQKESFFQNKITALAERLQKAENLTQTMIKEYKQKVENKLEIFQRNEELLKNKLVNLEVEYEDTKEIADATKLRNSVLEKELSEAKVTVDGLSLELETLHSIRDAYNTALGKVEVLDAELKANVEAYEKTNEKCVNLEQERNTLLLKINTLEATCNDLENKLKDAGVSIDRLVDDVKSRDNVLAESKQTVTNLQMQLEQSVRSEELQNQMRQLSEDYQRQINESHANKQFIEQLQRLLNERVNEIMYIQNSYQNLELQLANIKETSEKEIEHLKNEKTLLETQSTQLAKDLENLKVQFEELQKKQSNKELYDSNKLANLFERSVSEEVDKVVTEAEEAVSQAKNEEAKEELSLFNWSDHGHASGDNPFGELKDEEDGWGWMGSDSQVTEVETKTDLPKVVELQNKLRKLQEDYDLVSSELESNKIKCQKYIKKLKEMKIQIDNLERAKSAPKANFNDLDFAIQEELRSENDKLTLKVNELTTQMSSLKLERESLLKRVDTLTSANEQLVNMKERQDIEVQMWQRRSNELSNQMQGLQWLSEGHSGGVPKDLDLAGKLLTASKELKTTKKKLEEVLKEKYEVENRLFSIETPDQNLNEELEMKCSHLSEENEKLKADLVLKNKEIENLMKRKEELENKVKLLELSSLEKVSKSEVTAQLASPKIFQGFSDDSDDFFSGLAQPSLRPNPEIDRLKSELNESLQRVSVLTERNVNLEKEIETLNEQYNQLLAENGDLNKNIQVLTGELKQNADSLEFWKQKSEQLTNEVTIKESSYHERVKEIEDYYQQAILTKEEENSHLICTVSGREKSLAEAQKELERLKDNLCEVEEIKTKLHDVTSENEKLKLDLENLKQLANSETPTSENNTVDVQIHHLVGQVEFLEKQVLQLQHDLNFKQSEIQRLTVLCNEYLLHVQEKDKELISKNNELLALQSCASSMKNTQVESSSNEEIERLSQLVSESQIRLQIQTEQLEEKKRALSEAQEQMAVLRDSADLKNSRDYTELREALAFLEQEKTRLENLVQEKLSVADQLEREIAMYKGKSNVDKEEKNITTYANLIKEKDLEIARLSDILTDTREKLVQKVQTEEARMSPYIRTIQNKLDQALYTLHVRDVKCEELTQEILQLLEERDTLQIKLSESMRAYDDLKKNLDNSKSVESVPAVIPTSSRINELHVGYGKDPVIQKERESRHIEHMQLYQDNAQTDVANTSLDYGIFNWFFGGSPQPQGSNNTEVSS